MATTISKKELNTDLVINQMSPMAALYAAQNENFDMDSYPNELFLLEDYSLSVYHIKDINDFALALEGIEALPVFKKITNKEDFKIECIIVIDKDTDDDDLLSLPIYSVKNDNITSLFTSNNTSNGASDDVGTLKAGSTYLCHISQQTSVNKIATVVSFQEIGNSIDYDIISQEFDDIGIPK